LLNSSYLHLIFHTCLLLCLNLYFLLRVPLYSFLLKLNILNTYLNQWCKLCGSCLM
jgi:hypothetical protein